MNVNTTPIRRELEMLADLQRNLGHIAELVTYGARGVTENDPYLEVHPGTAPLTPREAELVRALQSLEGFARSSADRIRFHTEGHRNG